MDWRRLLLNQAKGFHTGVTLDETMDLLKKLFFIIDDIDLPKRGKKMEFIGRIYSHVSHSFG
jgi:hypothetical protein